MVAPQMKQLCLKLQQPRLELFVLLRSCRISCRLATQKVYQNVSILLFRLYESCRRIISACPSFFLLDYVSMIPLLIKIVSFKASILAFDSANSARSFPFSDSNTTFFLSSSFPSIKGRSVAAFSGALEVFVTFPATFSSRIEKNS